MWRGINHLFFENSKTNVTKKKRRGGGGNGLKKKKNKTKRKERKKHCCHPITRVLASEHVRVRPDNEALFNAEIKKRPSLVSQTLLSRGVETSLPYAV